MSEFSDSVHLYDVTPAEAAKALEQAGGGIVLATNDRVTSLLLAWENKPALLEAQRGLALDYSYGEDHGLWLRFYEDGTCCARLEVAWGSEDEAPEDEDPEISSFLVEFLSGPLGGDAARRLRSIADRLAESDWRTRDQLIDELGALLKLPAFRWLGAEQIQHGDLNAFPEARRVPKV